MSLDLTRVVSQIDSMAARLKASQDDRRRRLANAVEAVHAQGANLDALRLRLEQSNTTWLMPGLTGEGLASHFSAPATPGDHSVLATDGSHIDLDRHHSAQCYLINVGRVRLDYGRHPDASMDSVPVLYYKADEMEMASADGTDARRIEGAILGGRRAIEECRALGDMIAAVERDRPALAMLDGSLVMWEFEGQKYPEFVVRQLVDDGLLKCLDDIRALAEGRDLGLASYISAPRSTEVMNALRLASCPHHPADCDRCCRGVPRKDRPCEVMAELSDAALFAELLSVGERSAMFISRSRVVNERYGAHRVYFCYLNMGGEVARIEVPGWVGENAATMGMVHSLVLEQCRLGDGYPVSLSEAHQKAVLNGADRECFWTLVERSLAEDGMPAWISNKSKSKRRPWV